MCPTSRPDWFVGLLTWLDAHVRNPPLGLPVSEMFANELVNHLLSLQVLVAYRAELIVVGLAILLGPHPLDAVQPLLEQIIRPGFEILFFPQPQAIAGFAIV